MAKVPAGSDGLAKTQVFPGGIPKHGPVSPAWLHLQFCHHPCHSPSGKVRWERGGVGWGLCVHAPYTWDPGGEATMGTAALAPAKLGYLIILLC